LHIIRELIDFEPVSHKTDIAGALRYFTNVIKKSSTAFVISDFMSKDYEQELTISSKKHDIAAIQMYDIRETELPNVGILKLKDAESGERIYIDTAKKKIRTLYKHTWDEAQLDRQKVFTRSGVDSVSISTSEDYVRKLMQLFKMRA
jgi:uncharacterized protein (DUF58 family)